MICDGYSYSMRIFQSIDELENRGYIDRRIEVSCPGEKTAIYKVFEKMVEIIEE
jgi:hypothetical protein